jgi:type IV pilus assembly protein PilP
MKKYSITCRLLISFGCIVFLLASCDDTAKGPSKPTVVRKKVLPPGDQKGTVAKKRPSSAKPRKKVARQTVTETKPVKVVEPQPVEKAPVPVAKAEPVVQPPPAEPKPKPILAKTDTGQADGQESMPGPKSDISELAKQTAPAPAAAPKSGNQISPAPMLASVDGDGPLYNPAGKVDPFEPLFKDRPSQKKIKKSNRKKRQPRTPLERIDISQLKLVGIILASSGNRALVEESSGKGYVIKKGTYIGTNAGRVTDIKKNMVIVEEEYEDVFGKLKVQKKEIKLPKPPGEL